MKRLLRSIIDFGGITPENLVQNFQKVNTAGLQWIQPPDQRIFDFVREYFQRHLEMPSGLTVRDHFSSMGGPSSEGDIETIERLKDVAAAASYIRTNFAQLVTNLIDDQQKARAVALLKEASDIIVRGVEIRENGEKVRKQGVEAGIQHLLGRALSLVEPQTTARTKGDFRLDGMDVWNEYQEAKSNKDKVWGRLTGLNEIDKVCHGIKRGELWVHAAFAAELKTSFALNWCYNLVTRYRTNVLYVSLEVPYQQLRRQIYVIHSANTKWRRQGHRPLDYRKVRDGDLSPDEELFFQKVIDDFCNNPEYCHFDARTPARDLTIDDIRLDAELTHKQIDVGLLVIDHGGLVEARKKKQNRDYTIELNSVLRDAKKLALQFNSGQGVPVLMLFQINRQGKEEATKNQGRYKMSALSYANEAERSADTVTTTFLDEEHRRNGTTLFCNLKNRDNPLFEPFVASVDLSCRRIMNRTIYGSGVVAPGMAVEEFDYANV